MTTGVPLEFTQNECLETFLLLVENENSTRLTADHLGIHYNQVAYRIKWLEQNLHVSLFHRNSTSRSKLSDHGAKLFEAVQELGLDSSFEDLQEYIQ